MDQETTVQVESSHAVAFEEFGVMPEIIKALNDMGWSLPTDIQAETIPSILGGGDLLAAAETGSGKTGAFGIPVVQVVYETMKLGDTTDTTDDGKEVEMSKTDRDIQFAVSDDGKKVQSRTETAWCGGRGTKGVSSGKYYYEVKIDDDGLCRIGWATASSSHNIGTDNLSFGFGGTGKKSNANSFINYGETFGKGDVIGTSIDLVSGSIRFYKNKKDLGEAFKIQEKQLKFKFFPAISLKNAQLTLDFNPATTPPGFSLIKSGTRGGQSSTAQKQSKSQPLAIIIEPTRELAIQTEQEVCKFTKFLPLTVGTTLLIGGVSNQESLQSLKQHNEIIIGTMGKIKDFLNSGALNLEQVKLFVVDEADRMLDSKNIEDLLFIKKRCGAKVQMLMFSATLHSPEIQKIAKETCNFPMWVDLKGKETVPETVVNAVVKIDPKKDLSWMTSTLPIFHDRVHDEYHPKPNEKTGGAPLQLSRENLSLAIKKLKVIKCIDIIHKYNIDQCLIFVRTRLDADNLAKTFKSLSNSNYNPDTNNNNNKNNNNKSNNNNSNSVLNQSRWRAEVLHAGKEIGRRTKILEEFKSGEINFLICTDLVARGIDIHNLPFVLSLNVPDQPADIIHRMGRVGRQGATGLSINIVPSNKEYEEKVWWHRCKDKGQGGRCVDRREGKEGGCTVWMKEGEGWEEGERRIGKAEELGEEVVEGREWGKKEGGRAGEGEGEMKERVEQLRPLVEELGELEETMQRSYWNLKLKFRR